jgi:hemerythrin-like domain-containing protein
MGAVAASLSLLGCATTFVVEREPSPSGGLASRSFRDEHAVIRTHLTRAQGIVESLGALPPDQQRAAMDEVVEFFRSHIAPHAEQEEGGLYAAVDRLTCDARERFTASMRHEHVIVGRWIAELEREAARPEPDVRAFARRADNLFGLVLAHFEEEEVVLLPIVDANMTREEFEHATGAGRH